MTTFDEKTKGDGLKEKLVSVLRTSKVVKGGRIFGFSVVSVVGDGKNRIGVGKGKAKEVPVAIQKALEQARKNMVTVQLNGDTIYREQIVSYGASKIFMKPAKNGTGIIAGGAMRAIFEVLGVKNVLSKIIGSTTPVNVIRATMKALITMSSAEDIKNKKAILN